PACPTLSTALDPGIGQVAQDRQRLIARGRSVAQLSAFLVLQEAPPEPEMEEIARHVCSPSNSEPTLQQAVSFVFRSRQKPHPSTKRFPAKSLIARTRADVGFSSNRTSDSWAGGAAVK